MPLTVGTQVPPNDQAALAAARARRMAQQFESQSRVLTVFDRHGMVVTTVGERAIYEAPVLSPDGARIAVIKSDLDSNTADIWVIDVATGHGTRITSTQTREADEERVRVQWPVWSPDGSELAYVGLRNGSFSLYRQASNGAGSRTLLYQHPGAVRAGGVALDWSMDGRFLNFSTTDLAGGIVYVLPLADDGERNPVEVLRDTSQLRGSRLSPDGRFLAYQSDQSGREEIYVRPFDASFRAGATTAAGPWKISDGTQPSPAFWRRDGKEMYYVAADRGVMSLEVSAVTQFTLKKPALLFRLPEAVIVNGATASVSRDGQRVVIAVPYAPMLQQITMFDRQGETMTLVGEPGRYRDASLSPDGKRVAVGRVVPQTGSLDIWTFDVASGRGRAVTNDVAQDYAPIWSPDGRQVAYVSRRGSFTGIYRKAWDGSGTEERLFQYTPGADMVLTDWSADGKFLTFHDGCEGVLYVVPLTENRQALQRQAIPWLRDEYNVMQARLSPDSRFMAYLSNEIKEGVVEVYVRPFDASTSDVSAGGVKPLQVSRAGASGTGMIVWRRDSKEMYYLQTDILTGDRLMMALDVSTTPTFQSGAPRLLFKLPSSFLLAGNLNQWKNISGDGQRFVFAVSVPVSVSAR